ncbi:hypothetical protein FDECE_17582 [Fusarium decemcellulare]|nr:hypothetical protein FDECE_17582 [Fusarium decemcellulare]
MKARLVVSVVGLLLTPVWASPLSPKLVLRQTNPNAIVSLFQRFGDVADATSKIIDKIDYSNAQKPGDFTPIFLAMLQDAQIAQVGLDANTKNVTGRMLKVMGQYVFGFDWFRHGRLDKLVPTCSKETKANNEELIEAIIVTIRLYGGNTDCNYLGGPPVSSTGKICLAPNPWKLDE